MHETEPTELRRPWSRSDRALPRRVVRPLQEFLATSAASASLLFGAVVVALVWANVAGSSYRAVWTTPLSIRVGDHVLGSDLRFWVNEGLMALFFLLAGVELKRELTIGELQRIRTAILPVVAAVGGMIVPALLYIAIVGGREGASGWAIPMATDIALALGVLAVMGQSAPPGLKPLLLTLAIVDDIGAIVVIALVYRGHGSPGSLLVAAALLLVIIALQRAQVRSPIPYVALGVGVWIATFGSGVQPVVAGVVLGLLTPAQSFQRPAAVSAEARRTADETVDDPHPPDADAEAWLRLAWLSKEAVPPLARVEHTLLPWSSFVILPLFALANAGVSIRPGAVGDALTGAVGLGIVIGLVLGKPIGVIAASAVSVRARLGDLPADVGWIDLSAMGATAGVGFTVSLFMAELAFPEGSDLLARAKVAILIGSLLAGLVAWSILRVRAGRR